MGHHYPLFSLITIVLTCDQAWCAGISMVLMGPNEPSPWTEMDFNRTPPESGSPYYSRDEERCYEERKVYYSGKCWDLQQRGPCQEGQWLVLDSTSSGLRAVCISRPCPSDKAYWLPTKECLSLRDRSKCTKKETSLQTDWLGYGACKCVKGVARAMASNGACYQLYSRGFCDPGQIVGMDPLAEEYPAICKPDTCNATSPDTIILPYAGGCYPEGSHEPCSDGEELSVDVLSGMPSCSHNLNVWHIVNPPPRCPQVDHSGGCTDRATVIQETINFVQDLKMDKEKLRKKQGISKG